MKAPPPPPKPPPKPSKPRKAKRQRSKSTELDVARMATPTKALMRAMLLYIQNPGLSLQDVWSQGRMSDAEDAAYIRDCIGFAAVTRCSSEENWVLRRTEHWATVKRRVLSEVQTDAVQRELDELTTMQALALTLMDHITGSDDGTIKPAKPKSLEGVVGAFVALDKRMAEKRRWVAEAVAGATAGATAPPVPGSALPTPAIEDSLDDAEIAELAAKMARDRAAAALPQPVLTDSQPTTGADHDGDE